MSAETLPNSPDTSATNTQAMAAEKLGFFKRNKLKLLLALGAGVAATALAWPYLRAVPVVELAQTPIELENPDVWVHSQNLSLLPHDILQVPLLKSVLTEDFLFFYAQDEDWLSLQGAMRRISFDHDLNWSDSLLKNIAQAPADIYMWHDDSHALRYWALSLERDQLAAIAQGLLTAKLNGDKQLHKIGEVNMDGTSVPVLRLTLSSRRQMVLAAHQKRLVLLSDVRMASIKNEDFQATPQFDDDAQTLIKNLLSPKPEQRAQVVAQWQPSQASANKAAQSIFLSNRFFAQGYGAYIPSLQALRFDYNGQQWQTQANLAPQAVESKIWSYMPANAAFCASLPIDWAHAQIAIDDAENLENKPDLTKLFSPTAAACWYAGEHGDISQPLYAVLPQAGKPNTAAYTTLFNWGVATNLDHMQTLFALYRQQRFSKDQLTLTKLELDQEKAKKIDPKLKKETADRLRKESQARITAFMQQVKLIEQEIDALAPKIAAEKKQIAGPAKLAAELETTAEGDFTRLARKMAIDSKSENSPQLAFNGQVAYFSTNQHLIEQALAVGQKRYPNLQESAKILGKQMPSYLYVQPKKLAELIDKTAHAALPRDSRPNLREAYDYHMPKRLAALAKHPAFSLVQPNATAPAANATAANQGDATNWQTLNWLTADNKNTDAKAQ